MNPLKERALASYTNNFSHSFHAVCHSYNDDGTADYHYKRYEEMLLKVDETVESSLDFINPNVGQTLFPLQDEWFDPRQDKAIWPLWVKQFIKDKARKKQLEVYYDTYIHLRESVCDYLCIAMRKNDTLFQQKYYYLEKRIEIHQQALLDRAIQLNSTLQEWHEKINDGTNN